MSAFVAFLLIVLVLSILSPEFERLRMGKAVLLVSFLVLIGTELEMYHRIRTALTYARFIWRFSGFAFIVGTTRKDWYPLLNAIFSSSAPQHQRYVWWRERFRSPLDALNLGCPPVDLPFAVVVTSGGPRYVPLGDRLRPYCRKPLATHLPSARESLAELEPIRQSGAAV